MEVAELVLSSGLSTVLGVAPEGRWFSLHLPISSYACDVHQAPHGQSSNEKSLNTSILET